MQRKKLFKKKKIKILDARLLYKNTKCFAANKTPLNWMWIHNIRPWNSPSQWINLCWNPKYFAKTFTTTKGVLVHQAISLDFEWIHLSNEHGLVNKD